MKRDVEPEGKSSCFRARVFRVLRWTLVALFFGEPDELEKRPSPTTGPSDIEGEGSVRHTHHRRLLTVVAVSFVIVLDWLLTSDEERVVGAVQAALPALVAEIRGAYAGDDASPVPDTDALRWGLAAPADYVAVVESALVDDVLPRFAARGIRLRPDA